LNALNQRERSDNTRRGDHIEIETLVTRRIEDQMTLGSRKLAEKLEIKEEATNTNVKSQW
jgi:hypothetical protein